MDKIIIAVNLGHFKAYRVSAGELESPKLELVESYDTIEFHEKLSEKLTDRAGRFGMSGGKNGAAKGYGEPKNLELETEKRFIKLIAKNIGTVVTRSGCKKWYLAAEKSIHKQIIDSLDKDTKARLEKNIQSDLTKIHKSEILKYFEA